MSSPLDDLQLLPTLEFMTEGGGAFGPSSFDGFPIQAGFTLWRAASHPPTAEQEARMKLPPDHKDALGAGYGVALWVKFQVTKPLDPPDWENETMTFEHTWSLGSKSGQTHYVADLPDVKVPKGLTGGFQELKHLAQGVFDLPGQGKAVLTLGEEKGGKFRDLAEFRGRWYQPQPDTSDAKKKLYTNSGFMQLLLLSAPAVAAVDPSAVVTKTELNTKTGLQESIQQLKIWPNTKDDPTGKGPDGQPWGALYFVGLSGRWDTKKSTVSGKNRSFEQKVLYMTGYTGRVMVSQTASVQAPAQAQTSAQTVVQAPQQAAIQGQTVPPPTSALAPAPTSVQAPAGAPGAPAVGTGTIDLDATLTSLILEVLPTEPLGDGSARFKGEHKAQLGLKVAQAGTARGAFGLPPVNILAVMEAFAVLLTKAPTPEDAPMLKAMGQPVAFAFNPVQQIVERVG